MRISDAHEAQADLSNPDQYLGVLNPDAHPRVAAREIACRVTDKIIGRRHEPGVAQASSVAIRLEDAENLVFDPITNASPSRQLAVSSSQGSTWQRNLCSGR